MVKHKEHKKEVVHKESRKEEAPKKAECCMDTHDRCICLSPLKAALTSGIMMSFSMAMLAILAMATGLGSAWVRLLGTVFLGYDTSFVGMLLGLLWGFIKGFACGYAFVWLYNNLEIPSGRK
jgi:hypothetical protein